jgi:tetratricopeptide (TPR) repeat protein
LVHLGRLIEVDPEYAVAYHFRGAIFMELNNKEKALLDLEKALKLDPNNEEIKIDLDKLKM